MGAIVNGSSNVGASVVILADVSGSMNEAATHGKKIDRLREALADIWAELPGAALFAFGNDVDRVDSPKKLPKPCGGTMLHLALEVARAQFPAQVIVISDGRPADPDRAIEEADRIPGTIDALYIGPDDEYEAIAFMERLARIGAGSAVVTDLTKVRSLVPSLRAVLGLPAPVSA